MDNQNFGGQIIDPKQEVHDKVVAYFKNHGFQNAHYYDGGTVPFPCPDQDFSIRVDGEIDSFTVYVSYSDFMPRSAVMAQIAELDERISGVHVYRFMSDQAWMNLSLEHSYSPIFVNIDGSLVRTTYHEYMEYLFRDIFIKEAA